MIDILKDYVEGVQANANPTEFVGQGGTLRTLPLENSADLLADGKGEGSGAKRADGLPEIRETEFRRIKDCLNARASLETALRATQDRLIVATAKLHDYRRRSNRLEKELNSMTKTAGNARTELEEARAAADMWEKRGKEATGELYSQREAHMTEVKLLQRSLRTKLDDPRLRGRTDEATELAERLAKALLQRDETAKDNVKLKAQVIQVKDNIKGLQQELSMEQRHKKKVLAQTTMLRQRLALANTQDARGLAKHDERALDILKKRGKHKEDSEGGGTEGGGAAGSSLPPLVSASASGGSGTIKGPRKIPSDAAPAPLDPAYLAALAIREREEEESDEDFSNSLRATEQRLAAAASNAEGLHELIAEHEKQRQENLRQIADGRVVEEELRAALAQWREICESKESAVVRLAEIVRCLQDHRRSIVEALGVDEGTLAQLGLSEPEIDPPVESLALPGPDGTGGGDPQIHASTRPYDGTNRMDGAYRGPLSLFTGRQAESSDKSSNFRALYAEIQQLKTARDHHLQTAEGYQKVNLKLQENLLTLQTAYERLREVCRAFKVARTPGGAVIPEDPAEFVLEMEGLPLKGKGIETAASASATEQGGGEGNEVEVGGGELEEAGTHKTPRFPQQPGTGTEMSGDPGQKTQQGDIHRASPSESVQQIRGKEEEAELSAAQQEGAQQESGGEEEDDITVVGKAPSPSESERNLVASLSRRLVASASKRALKAVGSPESLPIQVADMGPEEGMGGSESSSDTETDSEDEEKRERELAALEAFHDRMRARGLLPLSTSPPLGDAEEGEEEKAENKEEVEEEEEEEEEDPLGWQVVHQQVIVAKTKEWLATAIYRLEIPSETADQSPTSKYELRAFQISPDIGDAIQKELDMNKSSPLWRRAKKQSPMMCMEIEDDIISELSDESPWDDLLSVLGLSTPRPAVGLSGSEGEGGTPSGDAPLEQVMVIPLLVGRRETPLPPAGVHLVLSVYRYDEYRFFVSGYDVQKGRICETAVLEGDLSAEDQRHVQMSAHLGEETVIDFFVSRMKLHEAGLSGGDNVSTLESALEDSSTLGLFLIFTRPNSAGAGNEQE